MTQLRALQLPRIDAGVATGIVETPLSVLFAALIMAHGIPALRQDWAWPSTPDQIHRFVIDTWSGWDSSGIGAPAPYPSSYLLAIPLYILLSVTGSQAALFLFLTAIGLCVTLSARSLVNRFGGGAGGIGIVAFALFNPWVYTKVVAGHAVMVLAYGGTLMLSALLIEERPRWARIGASLAIIFGQLQFFVIAMALLTAQLWRSATRRAWACGIVLFLPTIVGVAASWRSLEHTPYMLAWQQSQSVALGDAALLVGYFTGYANAIEPLAKIASGFALAAAVIGTLYTLREKPELRSRVASVVAVGAIALLFASGTRGPIAAFYTYLVRTTPVSGLFRELYDLVGYVALAYIILAAYGARKAPVAICSAIAGCVAIASWCIAPPAQFFVSRSAIPPVRFDAPPNTRYGLYPAVQPMTFGGRGSGADPNAFVRPGFVTPVNTYLWEYPGSVALLLGEADPSTPLLGDLSVATVVGRPWLQSDYGSLKYQMGVADRPGRAMPSGIRRIPYIPELALTDPPQVAAVASDLGTSAVFFQDAKSARLNRRLPSFEPIAARNGSIDARTAWVDARLTFLSHVRAAQSFGGIATTSNVPVRVPDSRALLVYVHGRLKNAEGETIASNSTAYRWIPPVSSQANLLRCFGFCVIAGFASAMPTMPAEGRKVPLQAVEFRTILPWLASATLPAAAKTRALRYNVRYDRAWAAFAGTARLPHMRVDHLFNAWIVPPHPQPRSVVLVDLVAAAQTVGEIIGALFGIAIVALALARTPHPKRGA